MPYSLAEVNRRRALSKTLGRDTSFDDLKIEVENLKKEIISLKQNQMICDHRISKIEENTSHHNFLMIFLLLLKVKKLLNLILIIIFKLLI